MAQPVLGSWKIAVTHSDTFMALVYRLCLGMSSQRTHKPIDLKNCRCSTGKLVEIISPHQFRLTQNFDLFLKQGYIFSQVNSILKGERVPSAETCNRFDYMRRYLDSSVRFLGEERACYMLRSRLMWFAKGLPHSKVFRETIKTISS